MNVWLFAWFHRGVSACRIKSKAHVNFMCYLISSSSTGFVEQLLVDFGLQNEFSFSRGRRYHYVNVPLNGIVFVFGGS